MTTLPGLPVGRAQRSTLADDALEGVYRQGEASLKDLANTIEAALPPGMCFALHIFTAGGNGYSGYVSNAARADMIVALRECADTLEAKMDVAPGAPVKHLKPIAGQS